MTSAAVTIHADAIPTQPTVISTGDDYWTITLTNWGAVHTALCGTLAELDEAHIRLGEAIREAHGRARQRVEERQMNAATAERAFGWEQAITQVGAV